MAERVKRDERKYLYYYILVSCRVVSCRAVNMILTTPPISLHDYPNIGLNDKMCVLFGRVEVASSGLACPAFPDAES
jgi:hypothetical protein